ncbi:MAG: hypothetical protein S4CHLAM123_10750 [Chlamydiales bacterium]|nr:hypothetical protein [Chlamydiales bacterium]
MQLFRQILMSVLQIDKDIINSFKEKHLHSRLGELNLLIPKTRGMNFYPESLEKGLRSDRALKAAVAEMYLKGVSTRKVEKITEQLCGFEISSTQVSRMTKELDEEFGAFRERSLGYFPYLTMDAIYLKEGRAVLSYFEQAYRSTFQPGI